MKSTTASLGPSDSVSKPMMASPSITATTLPHSEDVLAATVSSKKAVKMRPGPKKNARYVLIVLLKHWYLSASQRTSVRFVGLNKSILPDPLTNSMSTLPS
jgi:hypothetical protein